MINVVCVYSVSIVGNRLHRMLHTTATSDEHMPKQRRQLRGSLAPSADAVLHTPMSLSTILAHIGVSTIIVRFVASVEV